MTRLQSLLFFLVLSALVPISCATTRWKDEWKDQSFHGGLKKIVVVAVVPGTGPRSSLESEIAGQLKEHGIDAVGSKSILQDDAPPTRERVEPKLAEIGADSVLVIKFLKKETENSYSPAMAPGVPVTFDASMDTFFEFPETGNRELPYDFYLATMQVTIYEVASKKAVWAIKSETKYQSSGVREIKGYARSLVNKLAADRFVP